MGNENASPATPLKMQLNSLQATKQEQELKVTQSQEDDEDNKGCHSPGLVSILQH